MKESVKMDVMQAIRERRSVRQYQSRLVEEEILMEIMEAARLAPSGHNRQNWRFILVRDRGQISSLAAAAGQSFINTAPAVIAGVSLDPDHMMRCEVPAYAVDVAIAMTNISLAAVAKGLGTCWIGSFSQDQVQKALGVPQKYKVVELMTLGYPANGKGRTGRKPLQEIISYDRF